MRVRVIEKTVRTRSLTRDAMAPMAIVTGIMLNPNAARYTPLVPSVQPYRPSCVKLPHDVGVRVSTVK